MVQATVKEGVVNLESILKITRDQVNSIENNKKKVKALLADLHANHIIVKNENGNICSKLGCSISGRFHPFNEAMSLAKKHKEFLKVINDWIETGATESEEQTSEENNKKFLSIKEVDDHYVVEGNMHPLMVLELIHEIINGEKCK